ncbi:hypothetical protein BJY52DRAFT_446897 [Lactarius psammicola]|nr:hypothetical protein BJY52DRAFT_446897 [Lactarius psammicola]
MNTVVSCTSSAIARAVDSIESISPSCSPATTSTRLATRASPRHRPHVTANAGSRCARSSGVTPGSTQSVNSWYVHNGSTSRARLRVYDGASVPNSIHGDSSSKLPGHNGPAGGAGSDGCGWSSCATICKARLPPAVSSSRLSLDGTCQRRAGAGRP